MAGLKKTSGKVSYGAPGNNANSGNTKKRVRGQAKKRSRAQGKAAARNETNNDLVTCPECGTTYSERRHSGICPDCKGKSESVRPQIRNEVTKMTNKKDKKGKASAQNQTNEGKKRFRTQDGIGKAKYTISYHDGKKKHKDGSDFFDIRVFKNRKDLEDFQNALSKKGFRTESVNETKGKASIRNEVTRMTNADFQRHQYKHIGKDGKKYILTQDKTGTVLDPVEIVGEGRQAIREVIKSEIYNMVARNLMAEEVIREGKEGRIINFLATRGIPKNDMSFSGGVLTFDKGMQQALKAKEALLSKQSPLNARGKKGLRQEYGKLMWIISGHTYGSNSSNITDKVVKESLLLTEATRSFIGTVLPGGKIMYVYCHWDGYPEGVGKTLSKHYKNPSKIRNLLKLGDISSLGSEIGKKHDFNDRDNNQDWTKYYGRDRGDSGTNAGKSTSVEEFLKKASKSGAEYAYLFDPKRNVWVYADPDDRNPQWKKI